MTPELAPPARQGAAEHARLLLRLMRVEKPLCASTFVFLGAWLSGQAGAMAEPRVFVGALAVFCITAFGFVINDVCDVAVDALGKPDRPLASALVSREVAIGLAAGLALAGLVLSLALGGAAAAIGVAATALSAVYSLRLKRTVLLGNASVALLVSAVLVFGAVVACTPAGEGAACALGGTVWVAAAITFSFILAQEALATLEDERDDRAVGYRTTATVLGPGRAAVLVRVLLLVFIAAALAPWLLGDAGVAYGAAVVVGSIVPVGVALWWLRSPLEKRRVDAAVRLMRYVWVTGFLPLGLLG